MFAYPIFITPVILHRMKEIEENSILVRVRVISSQLRDRSFFTRYGRGGGSAISGGGG